MNLFVPFIRAIHSTNLKEHLNDEKMPFFQFNAVNRFSISLNEFFPINKFNEPKIFFAFSLQKTNRVWFSNSTKQLTTQLQCLKARLVSLSLSLVTANFRRLFASTQLGREKKY